MRETREISLANYSTITVKQHDDGERVMLSGDGCYVGLAPTEARRVADALYAIAGDVEREGVRESIRNVGPPPETNP